jgi:hypothetical protein
MLAALFDKMYVIFTGTALGVGLFSGVPLAVACGVEFSAILLALPEADAMGGIADANPCEELPPP